VFACSLLDALTDRQRRASWDPMEGDASQGWSHSGSAHNQATMGFVCHSPRPVLACSLRDALTDSQQGAFWDLVRANEREDGAVLALLTHKETGKKLIAASTHLFWNPAFPDIKLAQGELLCKMVSQTIISCARAQTKCRSRLPPVVAALAM